MSLLYSKLPADFKKLVCARFFFTFAVQMQAVILGWLIYDLFKDPLYLGLIGLAEAIPALGLALYAGYLVDRSPPLLVYRRVIYVSLTSGILVLFVHFFSSELSLHQQAGLLYSAAFLTGLARSFSQPAIYASVPRLVAAPELVQATAFSSSALQIARIAGPAFGGFIFGFFGAPFSSSLVCLSLIFAIIFMLLIDKKLAPLEQVSPNTSIKDELLSGARFVFKHPILFPALSLDMVSVLFGGVTALLPVFANEILMVGPKGLGLLRASPALGATVVSLYLAYRPLKENLGKWLLSAVGGFGICIFIFALSQNFYLSIVALALSGAFDSVSMMIRSVAVQLLSPDHMRGKISAVNSIFIGSSNELGEVESGLAAKIMGVVPSVYFGAGMCLFTVTAIAYFFPKLRKMDLHQISYSASKGT